MHGDEVLLVSGDFPATTSPWRLATSHDVRIRWLDYAPVTPEALDQAIGPSTRIFCTTWVHSFLGHALDLPALREVCRRRGVWFVVNASQALGTLPLTSVVDVADAITACSHKFLCGPYGTGVCWIRSELLARLRPAQAYWRVAVEPRSLERACDAGRSGAPHGRHFEVFGTADFFTFMAWSAAVEFLLGVGIERIHDHDQQLVEHLIEGLEGMPFRLVSPRTRASRGANVVLEHPRASAAAAALRADGIDVAIRQGRMRISPHCHNTVEDIDRTVEAVERWLLHG
jgi:selenocysteine lyase/cysteine desulfurase